VKIPFQPQYESDLSNQSRRRRNGPGCLLPQQQRNCGFPAASRPAFSSPRQINGADWKHYLGPNFNKTTPEVISTNWATNPPRELWRKKIGTGWSGIVTAGEKVYTQEQRGEFEFCVARDAATGEELWSRQVGVAFYNGLTFYDMAIDGPRSTPTIDGDHVFVITTYLSVYCLEAATGAVIWTRDFREEGSKVLYYGNAASPLVVGDYVILNSNNESGSLTALRKSDGTTAWEVEKDELTHASPVLANIHGVPQVLFLSYDRLVSLAPETGRVLWSMPCSPSRSCTAASPSVMGDLAMVTSAYGSGTWVGRVRKTGEVFSVTQFARNQGPSFQAHFTTPVPVGGVFYTLPSSSHTVSSIACYDPEMKLNRWLQARVGTHRLAFGSMMATANALLVLSEPGELVVVDLNKSAYQEVTKFQATKAFCWTHPTVANVKIYLRSSSTNSEMVAFDVSPNATSLPQLRLTTSMSTTAGMVDVQVLNAAGAPLDPSLALQLDLISSTNPALALTAWATVTQQFTFTNGTLQMQLPAQEAQQWFITRQK
jgi:outer membrane protein assembly factor BamB